MARVIDTRPKAQPRTSTIFDRGGSPQPQEQMFTPNRRVGGVDLPPGKMLAKAVGDPNNGKFISWDQELASRGVTTLIESDPNGTPALWKGQSTGGGRVVNLATGTPMSAPMRPHMPGIQGDPPHEGSNAGEAHPHYAYDEGPLDPQSYPQGPAPGNPPAGKMGRGIPFASELAAAGIGVGGAGQGQSWIDWGTQPHAQMSPEAAAMRAGQDAVNLGVPTSSPVAAMMQDIDAALDTFEALMSGKKKEHPVSEAQRRWAFANLGEEKGKEWSRRVKGKDLPEHSPTAKMHAKADEHPQGASFGRGAGDLYVEPEQPDEGNDIQKSLDDLRDFLEPLAALIKGEQLKLFGGEGGGKPKSSGGWETGPRGGKRKKVGGKWVYQGKGGDKGAPAAKPKLAPKPEAKPAAEKKTPQGMGQKLHDEIASDMRSLVEREPNHPHYELKKIQDKVRDAVRKLQLSGSEEAAKTFSQAAAKTGGDLRKLLTGGTSMKESIARANYNELRNAVGKLQTYFTDLARYRAGKESKEPKVISAPERGKNTEKSMDTETIYDAAGRAMRRTLSKAEVSSAPELPAEYLYDYLVACVEEAWEHERREPAHRDKHLTAHDRLDTLSCAVTCELVRRMAYDRNLIRAAKSVGGVTKEFVARTLVEKGWMQPSSDIYQHDDFTGNAAMGAMIAEHLELSVKVPWIQTEPAPVTPKQLHDRGPGDVSHLVKGEDLDPFEAIMARRREEVRSHWTVPELGAEITASDSCPVHGGRDMTKSMNLWNPMQPCTCSGEPNAYG